MNKLSKKILLALCIGSIIFLLIHFFNAMGGPPSFSFLTEIVDLPDLVSIQNGLMGPTEPLIIEDSSNNQLEIFLDSDIIWNLTNQQRLSNGVDPLMRNDLLDCAAQLKLEDMFRGQYFAHESPEGNGIEVSVERAGYQYILIGENLALGNFADEQNLVEGWMNSPGHRQNILNDSYREIGLATQVGEMWGSETWLAVQIFGRALSDCSSPNEELLSLIEANKNLLGKDQSNLQNMYKALEEIRPRRGDYYQEMLAEYNYLVDQYNQLAHETERLIEAYNQEVASFNACLEEI
jgi:hypothetical protein